MCSTWPITRCAPALRGGGDHFIAAVLTGVAMGLPFSTTYVTRSTETQAQLQDGLKAMQALLRARLREAQAEAGTDLDLEPLAAMLFASSVAIRVLGRAGQDRRLLQNIAKGAIEAARRCFESDERPRRKE
jgi:hypothetical protein